jgi:hypothetical protein
MPKSLNCRNVVRNFKYIVASLRVRYRKVVNWEGIPCVSRNVAGGGCGGCLGWSACQALFFIPIARVFCSGVQAQNSTLVTFDLSGAKSASWVRPFPQFYESTRKDRNRSEQQIPDIGRKTLAARHGRVSRQSRTILGRRNSEYESGRYSDCFNLCVLDSSGRGEGQFEWTGQGNLPKF